ncbi:MAG TPA: sugar phosphate nucleotidyltransferase, partial [Rheinheimera sp.]|uniref:sugar phosphate nucleotidyltransferase n=1 Tax=Rheinheimera sp. TaxID=1869214 RepID=UPI002B480535
MTGGRLRRVRDFVKDDDCFCFTYGDGVGDIDITESIAYHRKHGRLATLTATVPQARFGALEIENNMVTSFKEKPKGDGNLINGGFFILSPKVIDYIEDDSTVWEQFPLKKLAQDHQLMAYEHHGFWQPMDTMRDKVMLEELWRSGNAPWKVWN